MREKKSYWFFAAILALALVSQIHAAESGKIHRASLMRELNEIKALAWLVVERSGNRQ